MAKPSAGRFVWHELATNDVKRALAFYAELFGWTSTDSDMGGSKYTMLKSGSTDIGGVMPLGAAEKSPPHWRAYCAVEDVDAAARRAKELGGKVLVPPTDIPGVGRFAAVADPQGAVLLPFRGTGDMPEADGPPPNGTFCWDELLTTDLDAAGKFYSAIYGYEIEAKPMERHGTYLVLKRGDRRAGGIMMRPTPEIPPHWGAYVAVASVETAAKRALSLKGTVMVPPTDIEKMGRFAVLADPTGATISVFEETR